MKTSTTAQRLRSYMVDKNVLQKDIIDACLPYCEAYGVKMNKSDISQYVNGKVEPSQDKLMVLSLALGVDAAWLMGFDVPMKKEEKPIPEDELDRALIGVLTDLTPQETAQVLAFVSGLKAARKA